MIEDSYEYLGQSLEKELLLVEMEQDIEETDEYNEESVLGQVHRISKSNN